MIRIIAAALIAATPASAEQCIPTLKLAYNLAKQGMTPEVQLLQDSEPVSIVQVWTDAETEAWAVVRIRPNGNSCLIETGYGFVRIKTGQPT